MNYLEAIVVGLILALAVIYLVRAFLPKKQSACGCGASACKVPKVKLRAQPDSRPQ